MEDLRRLLEKSRSCLFLLLWRFFLIVKGVFVTRHFYFVKDRKAADIPVYTVNSVPVKNIVILH